jgi:hypothetical protein
MIGVTGSLVDNHEIHAAMRVRRDHTEVHACHVRDNCAGWVTKGRSPVASLLDVGIFTAAASGRSHTNVRVSLGDHLHEQKERRLIDIKQRIHTASIARPGSYTKDQ